MNEFDQFMKHKLKAKYYIRYADDFTMIYHSRAELEEMLPRIKHFLKHKLKLELHSDKLFIKTLSSGLDFLGWVHFSHHRVLRTSTKRRMFKNFAGGSDTTKQSYLGLLTHGNTWKLKQQLDI